MHEFKFNTDGKVFIYNIDEFNELIPDTIYHKILKITPEVINKEICAYGIVAGVYLATKITYYGYTTESLLESMLNDYCEVVVKNGFVELTSNFGEYESLLIRVYDKEDIMFVEVSYSANDYGYNAIGAIIINEQKDEVIMFTVER